jgi:hypothetical protein
LSGNDFHEAGNNFSGEIEQALAKLVRVPHPRGVIRAGGITAAVSLYPVTGRFPEVNGKPPGNSTAGRPDATFQSVDGDKIRGVQHVFPSLEVEAHVAVYLPLIFVPARWGKVHIGISSCFASKILAFGEKILYPVLSYYQERG